MPHDEACARRAAGSRFWQDRADSIRPPVPEVVMTARHSMLYTFLFAMFRVTGATSLASAQGDPRVEARTHYMNGKARFDAGDFRGAIAEFSAADQLAPSAVNDFNIALA